MASAALVERERTYQRHHHPDVVVTATPEVHREQRVPADGRGGEGRARRHERHEQRQRDDPHRRRGLEEAARSRRRGADDERSALGCRGEERPVGRGRLAAMRPRRRGRPGRGGSGAEGRCRGCLRRRRRCARSPSTTPASCDKSSGLASGIACTSAAMTRTGASERPRTQQDEQRGDVGEERGADREVVRVDARVSRGLRRQRCGGGRGERHEPERAETREKDDGSRPLRRGCGDGEGVRHGTRVCTRAPERRLTAECRADAGRCLRSGPRSGRVQVAIAKLACRGERQDRDRDAPLGDRAAGRRGTPDAEQGARGDPVLLGHQGALHHGRRDGGRLPRRDARARADPRRRT